MVHTSLCPSDTSAVRTLMVALTSRYGYSLVDGCPCCLGSRTTQEGRKGTEYRCAGIEFQVFTAALTRGSGPHVEAKCHPLFGGFRRWRNL